MDHHGAEQDGESGQQTLPDRRGRHGAVLPRLARAGAEESPSDPAYGYLLTSILDLVELFDPAAVVLTGGVLVNNPQASAWIAHTGAQHLAGQWSGDDRAHRLPALA